MTSCIQKFNNTYKTIRLLNCMTIVCASGSFRPFYSNHCTMVEVISFYDALMLYYPRHYIFHELFTFIYRDVPFDLHSINLDLYSLWCFDAMCQKWTESVRYFKIYCTETISWQADRGTTQRPLFLFSRGGIKRLLVWLNGKL